MALIVKKSDCLFSLNESENIHLGENKQLETEKVGIYYAQLEPGQKLKKHMHNRPQNGDEIFFFYMPCRIRLGFEKEGIFTEEILDIKEPTHIIIGQKEHHSIKNIGDEALEFEVLCAPKFMPGEVVLKE